MPPEYISAAWVRRRPGRSPRSVGITMQELVVRRRFLASDLDRHSVLAGVRSECPKNRFALGTRGLSYVSAQL